MLCSAACRPACCRLRASIHPLLLSAQVALGAGMLRPCCEGRVAVADLSWIGVVEDPIQAGTYFLGLWTLISIGAHTAPAGLLGRTHTHNASPRHPGWGG